MKESPYWWEDRPPLPDLAERPPAAVDILVVGGGYTGLSAAIAAHDGGAAVAVIDAGYPGAAASSRNGGMFGAHPRLPLAQLTEKFGAEVAKGVFNEATPALSFVRDLQVREGIDCDYQNTGRIALAWTRKDFEGHKRLVDDLAKTDVEARLVEKKDLGEEIATDLYHGGVVLPQHGAIQPRKFHDGLLSAVLGRGVPVVGTCEALAVERVSGGYLLKTSLGEIRAEKVILATNGYTGRAFPWADRRVFPLPSFIIATEPMSDNLLGKLAPGRRMMVETRARHSYFRISPDGSRILFGGRCSMKPVDMKTAARRLKATMCEVWPELKDIALTHAWTGFTGYAFTHMPQVGEAEGLHYALAYSGSGTVMAPYLGAKAAFRALGDPRGETAYAGTTLRTSWMYPGGDPHFLKAADIWYHWAVDPAQNIRARL